MSRNRLLILTSMIALGAILLVAILSMGHFIPPQLSFDPSPDNTVISADLRLYPGPPPPGQPCLGDYFPRLRVWGDGLVFLDISQADLSQPGQWSGELTPTQIESALKLLQASGFFSGFTPEGVNPAGTSLRLAAHASSQSVVVVSGNLEPKIYTQLIDQIKPNLQPMNKYQSYDPRIEMLLEGISSCTDSKSTAPNPEQISTQSFSFK